MYFFGPKDIKFYVKNWIDARKDSFVEKAVLDLPAGNGISAQQLKSVGARVYAGDLFPEFFRVPDLTCDFVDLSEKLPYSDGTMDFVLCQEGIEHVSDQAHAFQEFSRIVKDNGTLVVTTPNYSNLRARVSYLLNECELLGKIMPPNEIDSVWFSPSDNKKIYFGHVNLIGIQKLRLFAKLADFKLVKVHANRVNYTALMLFPFLYPFICYFSWASYRRMKRKQGKEAAEKIRESFQLTLSPAVLLQNHLIVEFQKQPGLMSAMTSKTSTAQEFVT